MGHYDKVLWSEGMFLTPQHLQQSDRHRDQLIQKRISSVVHYNWGLGRLRIDREALAGGDVSIRECLAVMPDGLCVAVPDSDDPPLARDVKPFFEAQTVRVGVYLAIPVSRPGDAVVAGEGDDHARARFRRECVRAADESGGSPDLEEIVVARKNLRILFEGESLDGYEHLRIAEVRRNGQEFELCREFLPAAYAIGATENMLAVLGRLSANLASRADALSGQRRKGDGKLAGFTPSEAAMFWLLHTVNTALSGLWFFEKQPHAHPELLYLETLRLIGSLVTFSGEKVADVCPEYHHDNQTATFKEIEATIDRLLKTVIPQRCRPIPLERTGESTFCAEGVDQQLFESSDFYLAVRSEVGEDKVINEIPNKAKISSSNKLPALIAAAVRGVNLKHVKDASPDVFDPGRTYFKFEKSGDHWHHMQRPTPEAREGSVAIYVPPEFTGLQVELMAVAQ